MLTRPLLLTLVLLAFSNAQISEVSSDTISLSISRGPYPYRVEEKDGVRTTIYETSPLPWHPTGSWTSPDFPPTQTWANTYPSITNTWPAGYIEEVISLHGAITAESAYASVQSIAEHATGIAGSAVTALSSFIDSQISNHVIITDDAGANAYHSTFNSIFSLLPTEQQSFENSAESRYRSLASKYNITRPATGTSANATASSTSTFTSSSVVLSTSTSTTAASVTVPTGGVEGLRVGIVGVLAGMGAAGLGVVAVLL